MSVTLIIRSRSAASTTVSECLRLSLLHRSNLVTRSNTRPPHYSTSYLLPTSCTVQYSTFIVSQLNCNPSPLLLPMTKDFCTCRKLGMAGHELQQPPPPPTEAKDARLQQHHR